MKFHNHFYAFFVFISGLLFSSYSFAQEKKERYFFGSIIDSSREAIPFANILLLKSSDSSLIKGTTSNDQGKFDFHIALKSDSYVIQFSSVGYKSIYKNISVTDGDSKIDLGVINLTSSNIGLKEVSVTAKNTFIEMKSDKMVLNMENRPAGSGNNALEALERTPGVIVNKANEVITLSGKSGIQIQINGRKIYAENAQLFSTLESMPSDNISKIEIISNPSSKYDADVSGILNIVLKKPQNQGLNMDVKSNVGYGKYAKYNGGINTYYNSNKSNVFVITNLGNIKSELNDSKIIDTYSNPLLYSNQRTYHKNELSAYIRCGFDYYLDSLRSTGLIYTNNCGNSLANIQTNSNSIYKIDNSTEKSLSQTSTIRGPKPENTFNVYYSQKLKHEKGKLDCNLDWYFLNSERRFDNHINDALLETNNNYNYNIKNDINILDFKVDYSRTVFKNLVLETGIKSDFIVNTGANTFYWQNIYTDSMSSRYKYRQQLNTFYFTLNKPLTDKLSAKIGIRAENENVKESNFITNEKYNRTGMKIYPTAYLLYDFNSKHKLAIFYTNKTNSLPLFTVSRIKRYTDPNTYYQGNPQLKASTDNTLGLTYSYNQKIFFHVYYGITHNLMSIKVIETSSGNKITYYNSDYFKQIGCQLTANYDITKWWNVNISSFLLMQTVYSKQENIKLKYSDIPYFDYFNLSQTFLIKSFRVELISWHSGIIYNGLTAEQPKYSVDLAIKHSLGKKQRWNVTLVMNDLFKTNKSKLITTNSNSKLIQTMSTDSRQIWVKLIYKLGNIKTKKSDKRAYSNSDIDSRVQGGE